MSMTSCGGPSRQWKRFVIVGFSRNPQVCVLNNIGTTVREGPRTKRRSTEKRARNAAAETRIGPRYRPWSYRAVRAAQGGGAFPGLPDCHFGSEFPPHCLAQIKSLGRKVEERERQAAKVEKSIKVARVSNPSSVLAQCANGDVLSH